MVKIRKGMVALMVVCILLGIGSSGWASENKIDINTAGVEQLTTLQGIGPAIAQRIVDYREANGNFSSVDEITNVRGIGSSTLEKIRNHIYVGN
jgi:competence protein ComEA